MKTAIVTGSTKGIGFAIAKKLIKEGYFVILNYAKDEAAANQAKYTLKSHGYNEFEIVKADLSKKEEAEYFINECKETLKSIDCIVLNAAKTNRKSFWELSYNEWIEVIDSNLNIPFFMVQKLGGAVVTEGSIIFIGSILGFQPHATSLPYGVSKAGVHFMTKALVKEFSERKITVNAVCPGFVDTLWQKNKPPEQRMRIKNKIAQRRFANPEEIAKAVYDVITNRYINGALINIDGGYDYK